MNEHMKSLRQHITNDSRSSKATLSIWYISDTIYDIRLSDYVIHLSLDLATESNLCEFSQHYKLAAKIQCNKMLIIFGVLLLTIVCNASKPTLITRFDLNETYVESAYESSTSDQQLIFPTIDPSIAEDARLTTVLHNLIFMCGVMR